jgi:selenocysteine lyase/cysteine desulfurase
MVGGGVVDLVTLDEVVWNESRHKEEAGSPNVVGSVALAAAIGVLDEIGMENIAAHEQHLLGYAYPKLKRIKGMVFYGPAEDLSEKVGVIPFNLNGVHHALVAAVLSTEYGIGVRNGYFCAQPYVKTLLNLTSEEDLNSGCGTSSPDKTRTPGLVRASFGCYSSEADVDALVDALERVARKEYKGKYTQDPKSGTFRAEGHTIDYEKYFSLLPVSGPLREREHTESA